jgi:hypothetical protein
MMRSARHVSMNTHPPTILAAGGCDVKSHRPPAGGRAKGLAPARALCYSAGDDFGSETAANYPPGVTPPDDLLQRAPGFPASP